MDGGDLTRPGGRSTMQSNPNFPTFLFDELPLHWQMTRCEKYGFAGLLDAAAPDVAIEIGTYQGGSLQLIARHARKVYSIDVSPSCAERLRGRFDNVEFLVGDSRSLLPDLLRRIEERGEHLQFVLIDGGHTADAVRSDIDQVLRYVPSRPLFVVFHDSFHPPCRKGVLEADWSGCPYVHYVEVDFVPGVFHREAFDTAKPRSMYGGLALAVLKPEQRAGPLVVHQSQEGLYDVVFASSRYTPKSRYWWLERWQRAKKALRRRLRLAGAARAV
jgi:hypothetical protein